MAIEMGLKTKGIGMLSVLILLTLVVIPVMASIPHGTPFPTPPLPRFLSDLTVTPSELELGDNVTIGLDVMNPNNRSFTYIVTIRVEGIGRMGAEIEEFTLLAIVELGAYESETVQHTVTPVAAGDFSFTVDGMTGSFTVFNPESPFWNNPEFVMAVIVIIIGIVAICVWRLGGFEFATRWGMTHAPNPIRARDEDMTVCGFCGREVNSLRQCPF